jgi:hypothetical protein
MLLRRGCGRTAKRTQLSFERILCQQSAMIWIALSLFFFYLVVRELRNPLLEFSEFSAFDIGYVLALLLLALVCAWPPYSNWRFEQQMVRIANQITGLNNASVHCNSIFDAIFDNEVNRAGHANPQTGEIVLQHSWCGKLDDYIAAPHSPSDEINWSMSLFVHEVMHIRGELNESKTECQAIQRRLRAEKLFGVPENIAKQNIAHYYQKLYFGRHPYFNADCQLGGAMDERLEDWSLPAIVQKR